MSDSFVRDHVIETGIPACNLVYPGRRSIIDYLGEDGCTISQQRVFSRDYWNDLPNYLIAEVNAARARRKADLAKVQSAVEASKRAAMVRKRVWEIIGGKLDDTPVNAQITGTVDREAYRIEKVIFESQPGFYVTAHLYLPRSRPRPFPSILAPLGHVPEGKAYQSYQTVFQNLARQGFAVLAWDPPGQGERLQYVDPRTNRSPYGPTGEHDRFGWPALLIGSTTTQFEVWDGIRALDYLLSRPEIDMQRIGCCGHSGGGTQTMFLCALEPRIRAAVVVEGHTENLAGADYQPPGAYADAEQNLIGGLKLGLDRGDLLCAFAPKPLLICYSPIDAGTTYSPHYIQGTEEIFDEVKSTYGVHGAQEKVALASSTLPHDYDYFHRRFTYQWFGRWLLNRRSEEEEAAFEETPRSRLWCTSTGQVLTSIGGRPAYQVNYDRLQAVRAQRQPANHLSEDLRELLNLPSNLSSIRSTSLSSSTIRDIAIEEFEYESEPGIRVPGWFLKPLTGGPRLPVVLVLHDGGRDELFNQWSLVERVAHLGFAICSIDLRTYGVTRPRLPSAAHKFYDYGVELAYALVNLSAGSPIIGQQTHDLLRALDYLASRTEVDPKRIVLFGNDRSGLACLMGAALDDRIRGVLTNRMLVSYESIVASKEYDLPLSVMVFGMLRRFDLPEICSSIAPRPVWLVNTVDSQRNRLPLSDIRECYKGAIQVYVQPEPIDNLILEYVQKATA